MDSIYHDATNAPNVNAYDPTAAKDASASSIQAGPGMDKATQRFVGQDSIYNADLTIPAVTAYDATAAKDGLSASSMQTAPNFDQMGQRFVGQDSIYNADLSIPAVTAYDAIASADALKDSKTSVAMDFSNGAADRFQNGIYRKGLRTSTIPEERDHTSFPIAGPKPTISKGNARGAALKANLKAMISKDSSMLGAVAEEEQENTA